MSRHRNSASTSFELNTDFFSNLSTEKLHSTILLQRLVTLNQEILHMPVFCQLDLNRCHVMADQLASRYCLVGESMYGSKAVKQLKLASFAQPFSTSLESIIRVYVLSDTKDALHVSVPVNIQHVCSLLNLFEQNH